MASVDILGVGGIDDAAAVRARGGVFDLEPPRREQPRLAAACRHRVKVQPAVVLRREHQLRAAPHELHIRAQRVKPAAGAAGRAISLGDTPVGEVGDPDRPGVSGAVRDEADLVVPPGEAQKRETRPVGHDEVGHIPHRTGDPWSIRVANLTDQSVAEAYRAPRGAGSVFHALSSDVQLVWSGTQLVFPAENDGWLHFYSVPASGGEARLLTPGRVEIEYAAASADGSSIVYSANAEDIDRRHLLPLRPAGGP